MKRSLTDTLLVCLGCLLTAPFVSADQPRAVLFNRDIRPILVDHCLNCHGATQANRQADLRLDTRQGSVATLDSGGAAIVAGDSSHSKLYQRIIAEDVEDRMPPEEFGKPLSTEQIALLKRWIDRGAPWQEHWAYLTPQRPAPPPVKQVAWPINPIDRFSLARLEREGLAPSPPADKITLIRRVTFDITGLPPTPEQVTAFLTDDSPRAYEKLVDALFKSPRYGERMATHWLDLARYADTHGYHVDSHRDMWRWRDWVIGAFNANMPYDQFTIEQLAGDLLPNATLDQKIATGFNRNNMVNFEGGAIAEEYRNEYVVDRVVTTSTVWLGQTMRCARCHDHKYDPFSQRDFFRLYAFFNNIDELGLDGRKGNAAPFIKAPTRSQQALLDQYAKETLALKQSMADRALATTQQQSTWERKMRASGAATEPPSDTLVYYRLDESDGDMVNDASGNGRSGKVAGQPIWIPGKFGNALLFDGQTSVNFGDAVALDREVSFSCGAWVFPTTSDAMTILARVDEASDRRGFELSLQRGAVLVCLTHKFDKNAVRVKSKTSLATNKWQHVLMTYDGSSKAAGVKIYIDGAAQEIEVQRDDLSQTIAASKPLRLGGRDGADGFRGMIDEARVYRRQLSATESSLLAGGDPIREVVEIPAETRTPQQANILRRHYLKNHDSQYQTLLSQLAKVNDKITALNKQVVTTMVMRERTTPRETFILRGGDYRNKTERVTPGTPESLLPMPATAPANRLGLARWLVDPKHPLTARVTVNRFWQMIYGRGLVSTADNFGARGQWPSHPMLLDWLATELVRSGWDVKHMLKLMVTSATYRQASRVTPTLQERDPENLLLARSSRLRLPAEMIRDSALFSSGLLREKIGGRSVFPYQPSGLWKEVSFNPQDFTAQVYEQGSGDDLYRRSLYTFWKRAVPPPSMEAFGAPNRETCMVHRPRSNTPLQALVLMNDPTYIEAARRLAQRIMIETGPSAAQRITLAMRYVVSRPPSQREIELLSDVYERQLADFRRDDRAASKLLDVGQSPRDTELDAVELAAWTTIVSTIMNLDEAITRN